MTNMKVKNAERANSRVKNGSPVSSKKNDGYSTLTKMNSETTTKENREHKDSVFVDLFYEDETAEKNLLSLYNALHDTDYQNEEVIHKLRIEKVLYKNFKNDISFEVNGTVLIFGEHQSTVNANMPLRCLMYAGRAYEQIVNKNARYRTRLVKIPTPEFYTFYNGTAEFPQEKELFLSDAFISPTDGHMLDLKVKVININTSKAHKILEKCNILKEYSLLIDTIRKYSDKEASIKRAIDECIARGILADYLKRKGSEVANMLITEYSYEEDIEVKQQEAMMIGEKIGEKRGEKRGIKRGKKLGEKLGKKLGEQNGKRKGILLSGQIFQALKNKPTLTNSQIAQDLGCSIEDVIDVRKMFEI